VYRMFNLSDVAVMSTGGTLTMPLAGPADDRFLVRRRSRSRRPRLARTLLLAGSSLVALAVLADGADAAAVKASVKKDVLTVTGTTGIDAITLRLKAGDPNTLEVDVGADGSANFAFDRKRFTAIVVEGGAGRDTLVADGSNGTFTDTESTTLNGGDGADTLIGEAGPEKLAGGPGDDFVDGNQGIDTIALGEGNDVIQWDPGDSNDTVVGGGGVDRLVFNGSNGAERLAVSAVAGGHAQLTRDLGNIVMDLDDVEVLDLRAFANTDTVTVNDLTGTDVSQVLVDLAAFGGGDDGSVDSVIVPPGVVVSRDGPVGLVSGLGAQVRVSNGAGLDDIHVTGGGPADVVSVAGTAGADAVHVVAAGTDVVVDYIPGLLVRLTTVQRLDMDLLGGDDTSTAVGNLAALISLDVDGGEGNDTLLGGNGADTLAGGPGDDFVDGNQGIDTIALGEGNDVIQWDPGDSNDTVVGGGGVDRLVFNGSNGAERLAVSAVAGGHAQLTRDLGNIVMDLDDVEVLDLRAFANTDTVTVNDLTGTDVSQVLVDLAAFGGGDDGSVDSVIVNGTAGDDTVAVNADGSAVVVQGLHATVRITGASPTADSLTVKGLEGNDEITATPEANSKIIVNLVP
jgi:Ca2+-binding RTX toxin-like protein